jgi:hypothetical protein
MPGCPRIRVGSESTSQVRSSADAGRGPGATAIHTCWHSCWPRAARSEVVRLAEDPLSEIDREKGGRTRAHEGPPATARIVPAEVLRQLSGIRDVRRRVEIVAVIHGAEDLAANAVQRERQVLAVAPCGKVRVFAQRPVGNLPLTADRTLRVDGTDGGQADAEQQDDERPLNAPLIRSDRR